jgi:hypothetical protein
MRKIPIVPDLNLSGNPSRPSSAKTSRPSTAQLPPTPRGKLTDTYTMSDNEKHTLYYKSKLFIVSIDDKGNHTVHGTLFANCEQIKIDDIIPKDSPKSITIRCAGNRGAGESDILKKRAEKDNFTIQDIDVPIFFIRSKTEQNTSNYIFQQQTKHVNENIWEYDTRLGHTGKITISDKRIRIYRQITAGKYPNVILELNPAVYNFVIKGSEDGVVLTINRFDNKSIDIVK